MWNPFLCGSTQINFSLEKTSINSTKKHQRTWPRATAAVTAIVMAVAAAAGVAAAAVVAAEEVANVKQTVEAEAKTQQSTIKKQKNGSEDNGRSGGAAVRGGLQHGDSCGGGQGNS
jgi:uncharacterized membrane protein YgcG